MEITEFHRYNKLARRGIVKMLACERCDFEYTVMRNNKDEPVLKCYMCGGLTTPGTALYDIIRAVNKEHYGD